MCVKPIRVRGYEVGCGNCFECQMQRRSEWAFRMQYETKTYPNAYFLTLTYDDEHLDDVDDLIGLSPANFNHIQVFIRELRRNYALKYFGVHEYGSTTYRKHYHLIIWILDDAPLTLKVVQSLWNYGFVEKAALNNSRIHYVTKYLNKPFRKYTTTVDEIMNSEMTEEEKIKELHTNFIRCNTFNFMSTRPAIGASLLDDVDLCNYIIQTTLETGTYPKLVINNNEFSIPRFYLKKLFTSEERNCIYFNNRQKIEDNEKLKADKLDITLGDYFMHRQISDVRKLERVNKPTPYELI